MDISVLLSLLYLSFYSLEFSYHQYFGNKKRRTTKVIRRIFSNRVFYAGRQPRYPAEYHKVLVINLPSRSTALTCRHTETFPVHLYYTQLRLKYQLEFRFSQKFIFLYGIRPHKLLVGFYVFWEIVINKVLEITQLLGCQYLYLFAADNSDHMVNTNSGQSILYDFDDEEVVPTYELVEYYKNELKFQEIQNLAILKPHYDFQCFSLYQPINQLVANRNSSWVQHSDSDE